MENSILSKRSKLRAELKNSMAFSIPKIDYLEDYNNRLEKLQQQQQL